MKGGCERADGVGMMSQGRTVKVTGSGVEEGERRGCMKGTRRGGRRWCSDDGESVGGGMGGDEIGDRCGCGFSHPFPPSASIVAKKRWFGEKNVELPKLRRHIHGCA